MSKLDVLLINPGDKLRIYQKLGESLSALEPPVWAGLMASYLRGKGISVQILDANAEWLTAEETAQRAARIGPLLTAIVVYGNQPSASTQTMTPSGAICSALRKVAPELKTILVGGHASALPERTLREEAVDFVAAGEGPVTLLELVQSLSSGGLNRLDRVRGLWYREGQEIRSNPPAPLVKDLDREMPGIPWEALPMDRYRAHNWHALGFPDRKPYAALYTTLGCPFHCSFCCIQIPFKSGERLAGMKEQVNSYRFWSPESVIAQIDKLVNVYGVRNIKIADEMFVLHPSHVLRICDGLIERDYGLNLWAYARVDTVRDGMVEKLKAAGFNWLAFGIEAASEQVRQDVRKGFSQDLIFKTIRKVQEAGIHVIGNFIFGLPEDGLSSMQQTLDLALELNCEFANFYCAMAYPGSQLYRTALEERWSLPESWSGYSQHSYDTLPLPTRHLSAGEVLRFRDRAFQTYFNSLRYLSMIEQKFGSETVRQIRQMASVPLPRKHAPVEALS